MEALPRQNREIRILARALNKQADDLVEQAGREPGESLPGPHAWDEVDQEAPDAEENFALAIRRTLAAWTLGGRSGEDGGRDLALELRAVSEALFTAEDLVASKRDGGAHDGGDGPAETVPVPGGGVRSLPRPLSREWRRLAHELHRLNGQAEVERARLDGDRHPLPCWSTARTAAEALLAWVPEEEEGRYKNLEHRTSPRCPHCAAACLDLDSPSPALRGRTHPDLGPGRCRACGGVWPDHEGGAMRAVKANWEARLRRVQAACTAAEQAGRVPQLPPRPAAEQLWALSRVCVTLWVAPAAYEDGEALKDLQDPRFYERNARRAEFLSLVRWAIIHWITPECHGF